MKLDELERIYKSVPIPIRGRRIMVAIANGFDTKAKLHRAMCTRELDPSPSAVDFMISYLMGRELICAVKVGNVKLLRLVLPESRSERATTFDTGERNMMKQREYEENNHRSNNTQRRFRRNI